MRALLRNVLITLAFMAVTPVVDGTAFGTADSGPSRPGVIAGCPDGTNWDAAAGRCL
jgi:hypothetical protein